jgi:putative restriction endonuclease
MNSLQKEYYLNIVLSLKQKVTNGKSNIAKPILLLTIFDLIEEGYLIGNTIKYDNMLLTTYSRIFHIYSEVVTPARYPYYYMRHEEFYSIKGRADLKTPSDSYIKNNIEYAYLDDGLWELLQDPAIRREFKEQIINHYLKEQNNKPS